MCFLLKKLVLLCIFWYHYTTVAYNNPPGHPTFEPPKDPGRHGLADCFNTLRPRQNGRHYPDILKLIFLNENVWISIEISLKFVPKGPTNNIPALVQIMAWRRQGDKPLSEPMMVSLSTDICATRPQWVKPLSIANIDVSHFMLSLNSVACFPVFKPAVTENLDDWLDSMLDD